MGAVARKLVFQSPGHGFRTFDCVEEHVICPSADSRALTPRHSTCKHAFIVGIASGPPTESKPSDAQAEPYACVRITAPQRPTGCQCWLHSCSTSQILYSSL